MSEQSQEPLKIVVNPGRSPRAAEVKVVTDDDGHHWASTIAYFNGEYAQQYFADFVNEHMSPDVPVTAEMVQPLKIHVGEGNFALRTVAPLFDPSSSPSPETPPATTPIPSPPHGWLARIWARLGATLGRKQPTAMAV